MLQDQYSKYFGFLEGEVEDILTDQGIFFELDQIKKWYNGYVFGENIIYNPWSILNFVDNPKEGLKAYWVNTSSNDLVKKLLTKGDETVKQELECLNRGEEIVKVVNEDILSDFVNKSVSYFDTGDKNENFYHALVIGMLTGLGESYEVKSNRESGFGRYDVMVMPKDKDKLGIIIEFKKVNQKKKEDLDIAVGMALQQIKDKNYKQELLDSGVKNVLELGIAFQGKELLVKKG